MSVDCAPIYDYDMYAPPQGPWGYPVHPMHAGGYSVMPPPGYAAGMYPAVEYEGVCYQDSNDTVEENATGAGEAEKKKKRKRKKKKNAAETIDYYRNAPDDSDCEIIPVEEDPMTAAEMIYCS